MKKQFTKSLALLLSVCMILSGLVFAAPASFAGSFPSNLKNGSQTVSYTENDAKLGKYLVEIDVVKYSPDLSADPKNIVNDAGDIVVVYKPNNGTAPEQTARFEDVITANIFNAQGKGQFTYYAVLNGFPQKASATLKKNNADANDTGLYVGIKVWNSDVGSFSTLYDFSDVSPSNGASTNGMILTTITTMLQYYPFAKSGSTSGGNLTLPAGMNATSCVQTFSAVDQWGVTMTAPKFSYTSVTGLSFSQDKNTLTVYGTGDANNPSASTRTVTVNATYDTLNNVAENNLTLTRSFTVTNSSTLTFAPTYANREKAGLLLSFKAGSASSPKRLDLNASYQMTTTNYIVVKNNASRTATVSLSTSQTDKFSFKTPEFTLAAGASQSIQLIDSKAAGANYTADVTAEYTIEGFYAAATGELVKLSAGAAIPCVYRPDNKPQVAVYDTDNWGSKVEAHVNYQSSAGVLEKVRSSQAQNQSKMEVNFYINSTEYPTYQSAGLGLYMSRDNDKHDYYFQHDDDSGRFTLTGSYTDAGSFGFTSSVSTPLLSNGDFVQDKRDWKFNDGGFQAFYGTIFTCPGASPGQIFFTGKKGSGNYDSDEDGLEIYCPGGFGYFANSAYLLSRVNVYSFKTADLTSQLNTCISTPLLSCYFNSSKWGDYASMGSSALKTAQEQQGLLVTNQANVNNAKTALTSAFSSLRSSTANGTYSLVHYKHDGDMNSAITGTAVDFYLLENNASNTLKYRNDYTSSCNKHTKAYTATLKTSGTYEYVYHYWNIDFSGVNAILSEYNSVNVSGQFKNNKEAVGDQLLAVQGIDTSGASAEPQLQDDVDNAVNALANAMRNLVYTSYDMTVTHKMLSPDGSRVINNDTISTFSTLYNKTATYGEVKDGLVNIDDGTFTIKNMHFTPVPDDTFNQYSSNHYYQGVVDNYVVAGSKVITIVYYARAIDDTELDSLVERTNNEINQWKLDYTKSTIDAFIDWFNEHNTDNCLAKSFSVFDEEEYNSLLTEYRAEIDKLDPVMTSEDKAALNRCIANYEMLGDFEDQICRGTQLLQSYSAAYAAAEEILDLESQHDAGSKAAQAVAAQFNGMNMQFHTYGDNVLLNAPKDGMDGNYYCSCSSCGAMIESDIFPSPRFNNFSIYGYDYSNRGASLRVDNENADGDTQGLRFAASCTVPEGAEVTDFGFLYSQTKFLNGGVEPSDNRAYNPDQFTEDGLNVQKYSMYGKNFTIHNTNQGDVYTYNLVLVLSKNMWNNHFAAKSYITYKLYGIETTVYDSIYSSRSASYIAERVFNNPNESPKTRQLIGEKFGLQ